MEVSVGASNMFNLDRGLQHDRKWEKKEEEENE